MYFDCYVPFVRRARTCFRRVAHQHGKPLVLVVAACIACVASPGAQARDDNAGALDWQSAIERTLTGNPALKAYGYQHEIQAARVRQAGASTRPELSLSLEDALGRGDYQAFDSTEIALSISWVMEDELKQRRVEVAQAQATGVATEEQIARLDAAAATARLYLDVLAGQARLAHADDAVRMAGIGVDLIQRRTDAGLAPDADVSRAQVYLATVKLLREDVEHELLVARHRLAAQWGARTPDFKRVNGNLFTLPSAESFAELKKRIDQNPDLGRFVSTQRVLKSEIELSRAKRQPQWQFSAGVKHLAASDDQALMAGVSIPLGDSGRYQARAEEAKAKIVRSAAEREAEALRIETALFALHQELNHDLHVATAYTHDILPGLDAALADTRRAYEMGRYGYVEWHEVQQKMLDARRAVIEASAGAHLKAIEIERLTGVSAQPIRQ